MKLFLPVSELARFLIRHRGRTRQRIDARLGRPAQEALSLEKHLVGAAAVPPLGIRPAAPDADDPG